MESRHRKNIYDVVRPHVKFVILTNDFRDILSRNLRSSSNFLIITPSFHTTF